jgi:hypothetical protein
MNSLSTVGRTESLDRQQSSEPTLVLSADETALVKVRSGGFWETT